MSKVVFDENKLTLGDLEDFEEYVGKPLHEALKPVAVRDDEGNVVKDQETGRPVTEVNFSMKVLTAMTWISRRHENPDYSIADARAEKVSELDIVERDANPDAEGNDAND